MTHQLQFLERAEKILIFQEGEVANHGTYEEISATFNVKDILDSFNQSQKSKEGETKKKFTAEGESPAKNTKKKENATKPGQDVDETVLDEKE